MTKDVLEYLGTMLGGEVAHFDLGWFEGGSKIYVNTISPYVLRDRVTESLLELRAEGSIASDIRIASECSGEVNPLLYNRNL